MGARPSAAGRTFRDEVCHNQLEILRRIEIVDVTDIQAAYQELETVRNDYDVVVKNLLAYLDAVGELLGPGNVEINRTKLAELLTAERLAISMLSRFTGELVRAAESLELRQTTLAGTS